MEYHGNAATVEVTIEVQQVDFQVRTAIAIHSWARAYIGHTQLAHPIQFNAGPVDTVKRCAQALELHIGSRRAQRAAQLLPVQYPPADAERAPQQALGLVKVTFGNNL